jgi:hypothetical protein
MASLHEVLSWREKGEGVNGKSALEMRDAWQLLVDFLQQSMISCKLWYFVVVYDFLLLVFLVLTNVNIFLSSRREFMLLFLVYKAHAIMPYLKSCNINMSQPKRWRITRLAGTRRFASYKLHCCNKYFTAVNFYIITDWHSLYILNKIFARWLAM